MSQEIKLVLTCGETTCAEVPGTFCQYALTVKFGQSFYCHLFNKALLDDEDGWLARCSECLEATSEGL